MLRSRLAWALLAVLSIVIAGCGGEEETNAAGSRTIDRDATLRVTWVIQPMPLDPHKAPSEVGQFPYISLVYDRLTQMVGGPEGSQLQPMVAQSWDFADEGRTWTFRLRDDVTFDDGSTLDAAAVKASLERALTLPDSTARQVLSMIDAVEAPDPTTVVIRTSRPAADLPYLLSTGVGSILNPKALDKPDLDVAPEGSGPYRATEVKLGDVVTYERREGYWDPEAQKAQRIEIRGIPDPNARISAIRSGQSDFTLLQPQQYDAAAALPDGFVLHVYDGAGQVQPIRLNPNRGPLSDVRVRQALNFAVDKEAINEALLDGQTPSVDQPLTDLYPGHVAQPPVAYTYDPQRAKDLLAEAGYPDGFSMRILTPAYSPAQEIATAVQEQLGQIGVTAAIDQLDPIQALTKWNPDTDYDAFVQVRVGYETAALTLSRNYLNPAGFVGEIPPEFEQSVQGAFDPAISDGDRAALLETASRIANEQAFDIWLHKVPNLVLVSDRVVGADTMGRCDYQGIFDLRYVGITR